MRTAGRSVSILALLVSVALGFAPAVSLSAENACLVRIADRELPAVAVGRQLAGLVEADWIDQDEAFRAEAGKPPAVPAAGAAGIATWQDAAGGCDGVKTGGCGFHTASNETDPWWQVDLGQPYALDRVVVYNRTDGNTPPRTRNLRVW
jgi:hypothetical protein